MVEVTGALLVCRRKSLSPRDGFLSKGTQHHICHTTCPGSGQEGIVLGQTRWADGAGWDTPVLCLSFPGYKMIRTRNLFPPLCLSSSWE